VVGKREGWGGVDSDSDREDAVAQSGKQKPAPWRSAQKIVDSGKRVRKVEGKSRDRAFGGDNGQ